MAWKSSCSIASDDDSSRHSFLSDCDSEFDLRPPPRYPAEKRSSSILTKRSINRLEPPMTRARAKAIGKTLPSSPTLPKTRRLPTLMKTSIPQNSFVLSNDRVNFLTDRLENCSLDEEKVNRNCVWPSRETNSHYTRPIPSTHTFGASPFPSSPAFGQHQAQLWSRFRLAASELRNDVWLEQVNFSPLSSNRPTFQPTFFNNQDSSSVSPPVLRPRQIVAPPPVELVAVPARVSLSKIFFILNIFILGLVLGYLLTSTLPPSQLYETFTHYCQVIHVYFQSLLFK